LRALVLTAVIALALFAAGSCQDVPPLYPSSAPDDIKQACAVTERKCTACHERDRIVYANHNVREWQATVERMRTYPASAMTAADTQVIMRCLSYNADQSVSR